MLRNVEGLAAAELELAPAEVLAEALAEGTAGSCLLEPRCFRPSIEEDILYQCVQNVVTETWVTVQKYFVELRNKYQ